MTDDRSADELGGISPLELWILSPLIQPMRFTQERSLDNIIENCVFDDDFITNNPTNEILVSPA